MDLTREESMLTRRALGLERSRSVRRNRVAVHANGTDIRLAEACVAKGAMIRNPAQDYGSMRVFCVTAEGAAAISKKLPFSHTVTVAA
ncbi:hypothetical protein [Bradyrhizobium sp. SZCCHNR3058]|uniref:hypothetical protein n=1 Tax=Bradyrhizobium sp. SZCCHNR3058 TaxID=3057423 RepID=UPI002916F0D6|nr:hypothetical protein [Bradyrhizobium sp. SZCCHNR3058]